MATREQIKAAIDNLDDRDLDELYTIVRNLIQVRAERPKRQGSFMSKLRQIEINAPEDFSANLDRYTSGEKLID